MGGVLGIEGVQNGVSSYVYEGEIQVKKCKEEGDKQKEAKRGKGQAKRSQEEKRERRKEERKKERRRDSLDPGESGLSHFEGDFLKF